MSADIACERTLLHLLLINIPLIVSLKFILQHLFALIFTLENKLLVKREVMAAGKHFLLRPLPDCMSNIGEAFDF